MLKRLCTMEEGSYKAVVYQDTEWDEFRVKFYRSGVYQSKADYHTDDEEDARSTANVYVKRGY